MPILGGLLATMFGQMFAYFAAVTSYNVAFTLALLSMLAASWLVVKLALAAIWAAVPSVVPAIIVTAMGNFMPDNFSTCVAAIVGIDVLAVAWAYWVYALDLFAGGRKA